MLTGAGDKAFCAGGDLKEMATEQLTVPPTDYVPQPNRTMVMTKPLVAAVNGAALAGGFLLAQIADLVIASNTARFGITEIKIGRGAPWAAPLPWLIPPRIAMELLVTGEAISATRAHQVGLVNDVVLPEELRTRTRQLVDTITTSAPLSVRAGKATVYAAAQHHRDRAFEVAEEIWRPVYLSEDGQEGLRAFAEKRRPVWVGR